MARIDPLTRRPGQPRVEGAEWQAGVTPGHMALRPFLDGEPATGACAANVTVGWIAFWNGDEFSPVFYRRGYVELRPCPAETE